MVTKLLFFINVIPAIQDGLFREEIWAKFPGRKPGRRWAPQVLCHLSLSLRAENVGRTCVSSLLSEALLRVYASSLVPGLCRLDSDLEFQFVFF